ncbi:Dihydrodipicolinate synthase/N-acetylneuraminate lyase [uncultured Pleomorphomonas sp.]|uniref:Dihydrodipicolinate synthase/N-acetylneuraminate lyase n=1 Tax=uncultured Pleomorphomonas sp. TaxID=442121 RepID=A0A212LG15_9HYPH|nr:dihydrodipicolinate synthase family protein [uncultured Pleomorphomonas sp.]SCM76504.1 Dihydrodipicolinate synthase/N-acetylneuraminate lyase [uncultured Pleomorphomonas sp.]
MLKRLEGIIPVMLTPFADGGKVDYASLERLIEWYIAHGSDALFAVCQSSEMQFLDLSERVEIATFVRKTVAGRIPVVASGHVSDNRDDQLAELEAVAATGVDGVVLVTNRLDTANAGTEAFRSHLDWLLASLPGDLPLGLYECPAPYRRLLSDDELKYCADSGRFVILKDVSCDLPTVTRRVKLTAGTPLAIVNANAAIAWDAMKAGANGFTGVFTNFHPDLYKWLLTKGTQHPELADELAIYLVLAAMAEPMGYPVLAKIYQQRIGNFSTIASRAIAFDVRERFWALDALIDKVVAGTDLYRRRIGALA